MDVIAYARGNGCNILSCADRVSAEFTVRFVWERDGNVIDILEDTNLLQLSISEVQQVHAGHYTCRVELTPVSSGAVVIIGPTSAGTLTVLGEPPHGVLSDALLQHLLCSLCSTRFSQCSQDSSVGGGNQRCSQLLLSWRPHILATWNTGGHWSVPHSVLYS